MGLLRIYELYIGFLFFYEMFTLYHTTPVIEQSTFGDISIVDTSEQQMAPTAAFLVFKTQFEKITVSKGESLHRHNVLCIMNIFFYLLLLNFEP